MPVIEIDGKQIEVAAGATVMDAAHQAGIVIPHFCYHKKLSIAANCRMCLVEVEKAPKPLPACATPVTDGMKVQTHSPKAIAAAGCDGVPADQSPARLPDLRPGRRMPVAGHRRGLRRLGFALQRTEAGGQRQGTRSADFHRHDALHPLQPLFASARKSPV
jgi:ferredoxin